MTQKITIQGVDNLEVDQFVDCILINFSTKVEEVRDISFPQIEGFVDILTLSYSNQIQKDIHFACVDYEPPYIVQDQRIKIAA